jgi:TonB-linked SusC/RagA family outer membrane protein
LLFQKPQQNITGTVTDTNGTLPGVTILIKGKVSGTLTDENGRFSINANQSDVLVFSYLGYKTVEVTITNQTVININLEEDTTQLKEIVLNAGYYSVKDKERTGSISHITAKDIETQPVTNVLATMQGRMSGVNITQSTGVPGGGFNIQIRGINSLRTDGNEPLYIVDGVPFSPQSLGNTQVSSSILTNAFSPLNSINPADIESIEVLKDADATAIYGSRGANGVVLITTKKGKEGKTKFSIHNYTGVGKITKHMKMMNTQQYLSMRQEAYQNDGIITYPVNAHDVNGTWSQNRYTDWHEELIGGTAYFSNLQATLSGGSSSTQYLLSGTYRKETTVFPSDDQFDKIAVHSNVNHKSNNNKFNLNLSVNYASDKNTVLANDLTQQAYRLAPNAPALYNSNGDLNWENGTFDNPLANSLSQYKNLTKNLIANAVITYSLLPTLELKTNLGYNSINMMEFRTIPSTIYNPAFGLTSANSILIANNGNRNSWTIEPQIKWSKEWSSHKIDALAGTTFQSQYSNRLTQMGRGFSSNNLINSLGAANTVQVTADEQLQYKYQALFGRINYTLKDKYIMNLTGRRDGSSRFGPNKRFANFGAIGAAWIFSNEELFNRLKILSFGKLRASYGSSGSDQIGDYQFLDTYSISQNTYNGVTGLQPTRLFNPDFGWEINKKLELAAELGFFKDRILLTSVWYKNRSSNQLVGIPLPATTGFPNIQANLNATIQNTGTEFELRTVNISNNNLSWHTTLNLTIPKNKLLKFEGLEGSSYANTYVVGQSVRIVKQYNYLGIDPENGTYTFQDYNNDGQISATSDRQYISDLSQKWFGGLGNQINFKQWSLDFLFQFVKQDGRNYLYSMGLAGARTNMPLEALNHWPVNGAESEIQSYTTGVNTNALNAYYRYRDSNATITDASFVRLKHLSLSYAIPSSWFQNISGTLYLQGQNLLTFTNYKGADPENQSFSFLPPLCQYTLGLQLNF